MKTWKYDGWEILEPEFQWCVPEMHVISIFRSAEHADRPLTNHGGKLFSFFSYLVLGWLRWTLKLTANPLSIGVKLQTLFACFPEHVSVPPDHWHFLCSFSWAPRTWATSRLPDFFVLATVADVSQLLPFRRRTMQNSRAISTDEEN